MRCAALVTIVLVAAAAADPSTQSVTIKIAAGALQVQAPGFAFIQGAVAERLRDGRSVRVDVDLVVLEQPKGAVVAQTRQSYALSFDLWEERFAVTRIGTPSRSISHRSARNAEAWCLEHLTLPLTALGRLGRDTPFWIRLGVPRPGRHRRGRRQQRRGSDAGGADRSAQPPPRAGRDGAIGGGRPVSAVELASALLLYPRSSRVRRMAAALH